VLIVQLRGGLRAALKLLAGLVALPTQGPERAKRKRALGLVPSPSRASERGSPSTAADSSVGRMSSSENDVDELLDRWYPVPS
jgi:hypothetical protein